MMLSVLRPTKQKPMRKPVYGFDVETYDNNKKFLCASIYGEKKKHVFEDKRELIDFFKRKRFKGSFVAATNLQFDFNAMLNDEPEINEFRMLWRGSELIFAKTYIEDKGFRARRTKKNSKPLTFIDTLNYAKLSVAQIGRILGMPKLESPSFIGHRWQDDEQKAQMLEYNMRDAELSCKFINFLFDSFIVLGATPKMTIASTAMSLYKNRYLEHDYFRHEKDILKEQFYGYYGGMCNAYARGLIRNYNYYDFNSLYPSVMINSYPDPNTLRYNTLNNPRYILNFDGISEVSLECPYMDYPFLPLKLQTDDLPSSPYKTIFPYGSFRGWYSNVELRKALEIGYVITKIHKNYYYKENCYPFIDYVKDLYKLRKKYKKEGNSMQLVTKLLMNSLYGKFGQKFENKENFEPFNHTIEELAKLQDFERIGNFIRIKQKEVEPAAHCIPIWAIYTTAYGRIRLWEYIKIADPVYVDTDSLMTKRDFSDSDELGKLKLEYKIKEGIIVKPKFYMIDGMCKVKGVGIRITAKQFLKMMLDPSVSYEKFMKMKEAVRRNMIPNEIIEMTKTMTLEDDKREWAEKFDHEELQFSKPLKVIDGKLPVKLEKPVITI